MNATLNPKIGEKDSISFKKSIYYWTSKDEKERVLKLNLKKPQGISRCTTSQDRRRVSIINRRWESVTSKRSCIDTISCKKSDPCIKCDPFKKLNHLMIYFVEYWKLSNYVAFS